MVLGTGYCNAYSGTTVQRTRLSRYTETYSVPTPVFDNLETEKYRTKTPVLDCVEYRKKKGKHVIVFKGRHVIKHRPSFFEAGIQYWWYTVSKYTLKHIRETCYKKKLLRFSDITYQVLKNETPARAASALTGGKLLDTSY